MTGKVLVKGILSLVFLMNVVGVMGAIPADERDALIAFYNNMNGAYWGNNWKTSPLAGDGFSMPGTEGTWRGITVSNDHVTEINIIDFSIRGIVPPEIGNLSQLKTLYLEGDYGPIHKNSQRQQGQPAHTVRLNTPDLPQYLMSNDSIPAELGKLTNLENLTICYCSLTGKIPPQLGNLTKLRILDLTENNLSGTIPVQLGNLVNLTILGLCDNALTGSIPSQLGNLQNLTILSFAYNQLSGIIPSQLANLQNLRILDLHNNQLSGTIPSQLGNLSNLEELILFYNQLNGPIPSQLGNLSKLKKLWLCYNQLNGSIPSEIGNLVNLVYMDLSNNKLSGVIPVEIGNLINLENLFLNSNFLNGTIPSSLIKLTKIQNGFFYFLINTNCLSASDPALLDWLNQHQSGWNLYQDQCSINEPTIPTVSTNAVSSITTSTALCGGIVSLDGGDSVTARGVCWSTSYYPTVSDSKTIDGTGTGSFTSNITDLNPGTTYYVRAYATNSKGTAYGSVIIFETPSSGAPYVNTEAVSSITSTSAVCGGNVTSDNGSPVTARGVCWGTSLSPNITGNKTIDGSGTGSFTSNITGLTPGTTYYIRAYATNSKGTSYGANVTFTTETQSNPEINLSKKTLNFGTIISGETTPAQTVLISNSGSGTLNWHIATNVSWIVLSPYSSTGNSTLSVLACPLGLTKGDYSGTIDIIDPNATNSPQTITVNLHVYELGKSSPPFGEFATPQEGASLYNSIPVTGWALDDIGIENVKIYNGNTYIGDAVFIEGARPDVETAFPSYPNNNKAGWGYMLLTHFLPNGGNGTYTLIAKATDMEGNEVTLGSKTITIDNANAVKPFGAIDTPAQGGTASGKEYINFGWALTPKPNFISIDGSTIDVYIDGVKKGNAGYNVRRDDIAELFPTYSNALGAGGYYYFDTTQLSNGLHTISWYVTDSAGNSDGVGSRYFTVMNGDGASKELAIQNLSPGKSFSGVQGAVLQKSPLVAEGMITIKELGHVELSVPGCIEGYMVVGNERRPLPVGSTLDVVNGMFYWNPGPGFVGEYKFVFIGTDEDGQTITKKMVVTIKPKN